MEHEERHDGQHQNCAPCYKVKLKTVRLEGPAAGDRRSLDNSRDKDMNAYKRMREHGIQPKNIGGSAEIEAQASTQWEVEHKMILSDPVRKQFASRIEDAKYTPVAGIQGVA